MRKLFCILMLFCFCETTLFAQDRAVPFAGLENSGPMPSRVSSLLKEKTTEQNRFLQREFMQGNILYGTTLNQYVDAVVAELLKDEPQLRSQVVVYIYRSADVNAYATNQGIVLVSLGLLAQISNESELAMVLGHEIAHVALQHTVKAEDYYGRYDRKDGLKKLVNLQNEMRVNESAADKMAIERFLKSSPYSYKAAMSLFDVLQYSDLPFTEVAVERGFLESPCYQFPDNYYLTSVQPIPDRDNRVDTLSTHPNIAKRRAAALQQIARLSEDGRSAFVQPETLFEQIRKEARMACVEDYLTEHEFDKALYNVYALMKYYPEDLFLEEAKAVALYGFAVSKNISLTFANAVQPYKQVEGEMQQLCYTMSRMTRMEAAALALRALWLTHCKYPDNKMLLDMCEQAMTMVFVGKSMTYADFCDYPMGTDPQSIKDSVDLSAASDSKYDRIRQQQMKIKPNERFKTVNYMLCDCHSNPDFIQMMNGVIAEAEDQKVLDLVSDGSVVKVEMLALSPISSHVFSNQQSYNAHLRNEKKAVRIARVVDRTMKSSMKQLKMDYVQYDLADVAAMNTESYNKYCHWKQWEREYFNVDDMPDRMLTYQSRYLAPVVDFSGTQYSAVVAVERSPVRLWDASKVGSFWMTLCCPLILPLSVANAAIPNHRYSAMCCVMDMETGKVVYSRGVDAKTKSGLPYVHNMIYHTLYIVKKGGKK